MDEKKIKILNDDDLDNVSGGCDDYNICEWSPTGMHEWIPVSEDDKYGMQKCKHCDIKKPYLQ